MTLFIIIALVAVVLVLIALFPHIVDGKPKPKKKAPDQQGGYIGTPVFRQEGEKKIIAESLDPIGSVVWAMTPTGVEEFTVNAFLEENIAVIFNDRYDGEVELDKEYLGEEIAGKLGTVRWAWRLNSLVDKKTGSSPTGYNSKAAKRQQDWMRDELVYYDDDDFFLEDMVFYYFLFNGFNEPVEYYDDFPGYSPPVEPEYIPEPVAPIPEPTSADPEPESATQDDYDALKSPSDVVEFEPEEKRETFDTGYSSSDDSYSSSDDGGWDSGGDDGGCDD